MRKHLLGVILKIVGGTIISFAASCGGEDPPLSYKTYTAEWAPEREVCGKGGLVVKYNGQTQVVCDEFMCDSNECAEPSGTPCDAGVPIILTQSKAAGANCYGRHLIFHAQRDGDYLPSAEENLRQMNLCSTKANEPPPPPKTTWRTYLTWCAPRVD